MTKLIIEVGFLNTKFQIETDLPFIPSDDDIAYLVSSFKSSIEAQLQDDITWYVLNGRLPK
jgi:hypothetical protein